MSEAGEILARLEYGPRPGQLGILTGICDPGIEHLKAQIGRLKDACRNYERAVKRLRNVAWRSESERHDLKRYEKLILKEYDENCGRGVDACARNCHGSRYQIHAEARALISERTK